MSELQEAQLAEAKEAFKDEVAVIDAERDGRIALAARVFTAAVSVADTAHLNKLCSVRNTYNRRAEAINRAEATRQAAKGES